MKSTTIVNHIIGNIIKEGKNLLYDKAVTREKVPTYSNSKIQALNNGVMMHGGYGAETIKKNNYLSLKKDQIPKNIRRDQFSCQTIDLVHIAKQKNLQLDQSIENKKSLYHFKNKISCKKKDNLLRANTLQIKQKQNNCLKLSNEEQNKVIIPRIKQRQQNQQESMRQSKRQSLIREYEEKKLLSVNKMQKDQRKGKLQQLLQSHTQKGQNHKFTFDISGDLLIFKQETDKIIKNNYPPRTSYHLQNKDIDNEESNTNLKAGRYQQKSQSYHKDEKPSHFNQNQKIKTARGLAFASTVMKTLNLSKMSMNGSLCNVDQEQFMKRNDLFNNNHSRQTTNVPYFQLKTGTVYTELSTNQVVSNQTAQKESNAQSEETTKKNNQFQSYQKTRPKTAVKSMNFFNQKDDSQVQIKNKTAGQQSNADQINLKTQFSLKKRPQTCRTGRIITANKQLAISMLQ